MLLAPIIDRVLCFGVDSPHFRGQTLRLKDVFAKIHNLINAEAIIILIFPIIIIVCVPDRYSAILCQVK